MKTKKVRIYYYWHTEECDSSADVLFKNHHHCFNEKAEAISSRESFVKHFPCTKIRSVFVEIPWVKPLKYKWVYPSDMVESGIEDDRTEQAEPLHEANLEYPEWSGALGTTPGW